MIKNYPMVEFHSKCLDIIETWDVDKYIYIPAEYLKVSHIEVKNNLIKYGYNVVLINADFKGLILIPEIAERYSDDPLIIDQKINFDNKDFQNLCARYYNVNTKVLEVSHKILFLKLRYNLTKLADTGNNCIERSVTLQRKDLIFTAGILHKDITHDSDKKYQCDRTKGN